MTSLYILIALLFHAPLCFTYNSRQQAPITGGIPFTFRNATIDDLDDITTVHLDAFRSGPTWSYIRQFADLYPNYTWSCQRETFKQIYMNNTTTGTLVIKVVSVPDAASPRRERVVSISAWDMSLLNQTREESLSSSLLAWLQVGMLSEIYGNTAANSGFDCKAHLDINMTRAQHYQKAMLEAEEQYLTKPYGSQLRLGLLATHPKWDGNGFAARHIRWGKERLAELNDASENPNHRLPITLIGTPAGYPLYVSEGFEGVKNITIERLDGGERLWYEAMKFEEGEG